MRRLDGTVEALGRRGLRLDSIMPADAPALAELSGAGLRVRLLRRPEAPPVADGGPVPDYVHHHDVAILAGAPFAHTDPSGDLRIVEVALPA